MASLQSTGNESLISDYYDAINVTKFSNIVEMDKFLKDRNYYSSLGK